MLHRTFQFLRQFDRNLWVLSMGWFVGALGFSASMPFVSIYFHAEYGMSITEIGVFFGALAIVRSAFQLFGGEISDRVSRKSMLVHTQLWRGLSFFVLALALYAKAGFWPVATILLINAVFGAMFHPVANALVSDIVPREKRLDGYAITRSAGNLGWAVGPALGGFLATSSYGLLFMISAVVTVISGIVFWTLLKMPAVESTLDRFKPSDLLAIRKDPILARHSLLIFLLYLVVAQLIVPFSVYSVEIVGITKAQLGYLYTINGLLVVALQIPVTRLLAKFKLSTQLATGAFFYAVGYGMVGILVGFKFFVIALVVVTVGEVIMSPPSLTLTSRLAPEGRMGRYMGIFSFFVAGGWSLGPLFGGVVLDHFGYSPALAWMLISSLAAVAGLGYLLSRKKFAHVDHEDAGAATI